MLFSNSSFFSSQKGIKYTIFVNKLELTWKEPDATSVTVGADRIVGGGSCSVENSNGEDQGPAPETRDEQRIRKRYFVFSFKLRTFA